MTLIPSQLTAQVPQGRVSSWITKNNTSIPIANVGDFDLRDVRIHVTEAFNDSGTDTIGVGYTGSVQAFATNTDVSSTGIKSVTLGSEVGYNQTAREITIYYNGQNSNASTGKALVTVFFDRVPPTP